MNLTEIADFISKAPLGILSGYLAGLVGTVLAIYSIVADRKSSKKNEADRKNYEYLFKLAELNIDRSIADSEIAEKRSQIDKMSVEVIELQEQIKREIPIEAKRAVLQDRLNSSVEDLTKFYSDVKNIRAQLEKLGTSVPVSEELLNKVKAEIQPKFLLKEKMSNVKTHLTVSTSAAAIFPVLLPGEFSELTRNIILLASSIYLIQLVNLYIQKQRGISSEESGTGFLMNER